MNIINIRRIGRLPLIKRFLKKTFYKTIEKIPISELNSGLPVIIQWPEKIKKPKIGIIKDDYQIKGQKSLCYWQKFEKFLKNNEIPYGFVEITTFNWISNVKKFDIIIWRPKTDPISTQIARTKIYFIEKYIKKFCYPSYREIWSYEDKNKIAYIMKLKEIPIVNTFISENEGETLRFLERCEFPIVSKIRDGSASMGVELIANKKKAKILTKKVFSYGRKNHQDYSIQKNYVYFQEFIPNVETEIRVIVVGNKFFGFYKKPIKGDFKASGSGIIVKEDIPHEAMLLAKKVKEKMKSVTLAVDMIYHPKKKKLLIIEASIFSQIRTSELMKKNNIPGYYELIDGKFEYRIGNYWIQEFTLMEVLKNYIGIQEYNK